MIVFVFELVRGGGDGERLGMVLAIGRGAGRLAIYQLLKQRFNLSIIQSTVSITPSVEIPRSSCFFRLNILPLHQFFS